MYLSTTSPQMAQILDCKALHQSIREATFANLELMKWLENPIPLGDNHWSVNVNSLLCWKGCIFVPEGQDLRLQILCTKHDHVLAGHFSQSKMLSLVCREYFWPKLWEFMVDYVNSCSVCTRNKSRRHWPYGYLKQLPIPLQPWDSILMDFIKQLPPSEGFMEILVMINWLTKQAMFIPAHRSIDALGLAHLFIQHIFSKHRVPSHVTSDRGSEFVSRFFKSLVTALQMKLHYTSGYHPEADGQTERTNQTLEQYLRTYCNYQ